jgi:hypothetical protein
VSRGGGTAPVVSVVVHLDADPATETRISGQVESRYGTQEFTGWLDLLGQLEALVERCRQEPPAPSRHPDDTDQGR